MNYELLKKINELCGKTKYCYNNNICPFYDHNTGACVFAEYPSDWNVDLISEKINAYFKFKGEFENGKFKF